MQLPNIHSNFIPDPGHYVFNIDFSAADVEVVAWDSGCSNMKRAFREGLDNHLLNARDIFGLPITDDELRDENHVENVLKKKYEGERYQAKRGGHGTNYLASPKTIAAALRIPVKDAERFQKLYFETNPEILEWHERIEHDIQTKGYVQNIFGYHVHFFDRLESIMSNAVAWIPQSTVGNLTNYLWDNLVTNLGHLGLGIWFQVHDSVVGQFPSSQHPSIIPKMYEQAQIVMPYEDPRIVPSEIEVSNKSWGHVKKIPWEVENV